MIDLSAGDRPLFGLRQSGTHVVVRGANRPDMRRVSGGCGRR